MDPTFTYPYVYNAANSGMYPEDNTNISKQKIARNAHKAFRTPPTRHPSPKRVRRSCKQLDQRRMVAPEFDDEHIPVLLRRRLELDSSFSPIPKKGPTTDHVDGNESDKNRTWFSFVGLEAAKIGIFHMFKMMWKNINSFGIQHNSFLAFTFLGIIYEVSWAEIERTTILSCEPLGSLITPRLVKIRDKVSDGQNESDYQTGSDAKWSTFSVEPFGSELNLPDIQKFSQRLVIVKYIPSDYKPSWTQGGHYVYMKYFAVSLPESGAEIPYTTTNRKTLKNITGSKSVYIHSIDRYLELTATLDSQFIASPICWKHASMIRDMVSDHLFGKDVISQEMPYVEEHNTGSEDPRVGIADDTLLMVHVDRSGDLQYLMNILAVYESNGFQYIIEGFSELECTSNIDKNSSFCSPPNRPMDTGDLNYWTVSRLLEQSPSNEYQWNLTEIMSVIDDTDFLSNETRIKN